MASQYAFATLLTSDSYLPGALTLAAALHDLHPHPAVAPEVDFQTVCLVTPESVDVSTIKLLRRAFDLVVGVEILEQENDKGLRLLGRLDLNTVLTKLHVFRLTQFSKIIFLDADVLPIRPLSHLFNLPNEFSAVPDVGWPDIFNSGLLVLSPGEDKFDELTDLLRSKGSWDGGDQGILNEWRGSNWNRLSFTYNTTPTAAYTYAPAYERFGSKISAIHFIGPNKPWNSIAYRSVYPFGGSRKGPQSSQAYDYDSLVDRWFEVYDRHFRSQTIVPESEFEIKKYIAAWDEQSGTGAEFVSSGPIHAGGTLGLEDLRRMALEGISSRAFSNDERSGEGEYQSMPIEGRIDLMRPSKMPQLEVPDDDKTPTGASPRMGTLPTPGPDEFPPSPHPQPVPLPSPPKHHQEFAPPQTQHHHHYESHIHEPQPARPSSPPMLIWNPAVEPPPNIQPAANAFPTDTYFTNVWDKPGLQPSQNNSQSPGGGFFEAPPATQIPEILKEQGHFSSIIGNAGDMHDPDRSKVKSVFPWENKPRHLPGRVFPSGDAPSPSSFMSPEQATHLSLAQETKEAAPPPPMPPAFSPTRGLPDTLSFANAWDTVPGIQKYASRLVTPSPAVSPAAYKEDDSWKRSGSWASRSDASSQDGDDEDNMDNDDETGTADQSEEDDKNTDRRRRSGSSSISASYAIKGKKKEYRVRGVQTISPQMRSQGVQVGFGSHKPYPQQEVPNRKPSRSKGQWAPSTSSLLPPLTVRDVSIGAEPSMATAAPSPAPSRDERPARVRSPSVTPPGMRSPREFTHPKASAKNGQSAIQATPSPAISSLTTAITASTPVSQMPESTPSTGSTMQRQPSDSTGTSGGSPPSSTGPLSPPEGVPIGLPSPLGAARKPGRVFDPARGVDVFKRGSEEVLARFLRMGSWEDESR